MTTKSNISTGETRTWLAYIIVGLGIVGITAISWIAIGYAPSAGRAGVARMVFTSVLPLLGTWVGAVLAFYFSKDNLQAASRTTLDAVRAAGGLAADTQVTSAMIPVNRIRPREDVTDDAAAQALPLSQLYGMMQASGMSRVPIFANGAVLYVVHEPDIDKFAQGKGVASTALPLTETLGTLLLDGNVAKAVKAYVAVAGTATLADARSELAKVSEAKDVFVTDDGTKSGKVLGWFTNSDLARAA